MNIYATSCQHCGGVLTPAGGVADATPAPRVPCVKCGHTKLALVSPVRMPDPNSTGFVVDLPLVAYVVDQRARTAGQFRAQVCLGCGYTELYAMGLASLERLAGKAPGVAVVEVPAEPAYR